MYVSRLFGVSFITMLVSGVDGQCMNLLSSKNRCRREGKVFNYMSLRRCLSTCLNQKDCLMLQWRPSSLKCFISSKQATVSSLHGSCLTMGKMECQPFDHTCMERTSNQVYNKDVSVKRVDELDCRFLCVLWSSCTAYTWDGRTCYLQEWSPSAHVHDLGTKVNSKNKQGRKETDCKTGERVVTFRYGAISFGAKKVDVYGNVTRCFDLLLGRSLYSTGMWNTQDKACWAHKKTLNAPGLVAKKFKLINFVTSTQFKDSTQKACVKTTKGYSYKPSYGVLLEVSSRSECLHICLSTLNCHSISWGGPMLCYLQQVPAEIKEWTHSWSLHVVEPCDPEKPMARSQTQGKAVSWCLRRVSTDDSNIRGLVLIPEVVSLLQCCVVCNRASHCNGVTWSPRRANQKICYIQTDKDGSPAWKVSPC